MTPQERYRALLAAERDRRAPRGGEDARERLLDQLEQMAQRFAVAPQHHLRVDDMSIAEMLACRWFLPEELMPAGLGSEDEIWAQYQARAALHHG